MKINDIKTIYVVSYRIIFFRYFQINNNNLITNIRFLYDITIL